MRQVNFAKWFVFFLLLLTSYGCSALPDVGFCPSESCYFTVEESHSYWPTMQYNGSTLYKVGPYKVRVPPHIVEVELSPLYLVNLHYRESSVSIALETLSDYGLQGQGLRTKQRGGRLIDLPKIIFEKTPKSILPENTELRELWKIAFQEKELRFKGAKEGVIFRKGKLSAYIAEVRHGDINVECFVTHENYPDTILRIMGQGTDVEVIKNIVGSIEL